MSSTDTATMTVTNVSTGLNVTTAGTLGTVQGDSQLTAVNGFDLTTRQANSGLSYEVITLNNKTVKEVPPSVVVKTQYNQSEAYNEVDFTLTYTDIPEGSEVEIQSSVSQYNVSKRPINGTSNIGLIGNNLGPIDANFTLNLWIPGSSTLSSKSDLSISLARIEGGSGGPEKKIILAKTELKLAQ